MNDGKLLPAGVIVAIAAACWFGLPPPAGLHDSVVLARVSSLSLLRLGQQGLSITQVRAAQTAFQEETDRQGLGRPEMPAGDQPSEQPSERAASNAADDDRDVQAAAILRSIWSEARDPRWSRPATERTWRLFLLFAATITLVLADVAPILIVSVGGLAVSILSGVLTPTQAFSGYSEPILILIVVSFTIAVGVSKSGLGRRLAYNLISRFGGSTLGLGYSLVVTDVLIAPAFPSNTARSGVLYPIVEAVAVSGGSEPYGASRAKLGAYLMLNSIVGLALSSALWLTAMGANPTGARLAQQIADVPIGFGSWFLAASAPTIVALIACPWVLYRVFPPQTKSTPEARQWARRKLIEMGPLGRDQRITAVVFGGLVALWALSEQLDMNTAAIALAGLFVLMITGVITVEDASHGKGPATFAWFGALFALSTQLNLLGFMDWVGQSAAGMVQGYSWPAVYAFLLTAYIVMHYGFVSQTAHLLAVMPAFLQVGVAGGVPPRLMAMMLLLATNFFSAMTPQASSANAIFVGSGYLESREIYRVGGGMTLLNALIYGLLGTLWLLWLP